MATEKYKSPSSDELMKGKDSSWRAMPARRGDHPQEPPEVTHPNELPSATTPSDPSGLDALLENEHFPLMLAASEVLFGTIFDWFTTSPEEELLDEQLGYAEMQRLRASGVFSEEEMAQIESGFGPMVNRVAGNVASRGLGGSASGAEIIAQAQAAPYHKLQAQAALHYQNALSAASQMVQSLAQEDLNFRRSFGQLTKLYEVMMADSEGGEVSPTDPLFNDFQEMTKKYNELREKMEKRGKN